jgi:hypothetical protein
MASLFNPFTWFAMPTYTQGPMPAYMNYSGPVDNTPSKPTVWGTNPPNANLKIPTGLNPGWIQAVPTYATTSPVQNQYDWGSHPYQPGPTFDANLAKQGQAQSQPWGLQQPFKPMTMQDYANVIKQSTPVPAPVATPPKASPFASVTTIVPKAAPAPAPVATKPTTTVYAPKPAPAPAPVVKAPAYVPPPTAPKAPVNLAQALKATQSAPTAKR